MERLDHELIDAGDGRRLDRFGARVVDRPAPAASSPRRDPGLWAGTDARFTRGGWFAGPGLESPRIQGPDPWAVAMGSLVFECQLGASGQVGLFPEHALSLPWFLAQVDSASRRAVDGGEPAHVLNLFGHTGLATLALASDGAAVTHVDASRPAVAQARANASRSGLDDRPIRWIVDDAIVFSRREARRGRSYQGVIVDPPSYGHAGKRTWLLEERLDELLGSVAAILDPAGGFVLLTAHSLGVGTDRLARSLGRALGRAERQVESGSLGLVARSGARLEAGSYARTVLPERSPSHDTR